MPPTTDTSLSTEDPTSATAGVIHDIGYRHHDGPRLGRAYIRRSLLVESTRGAFGLGRTGRAKVIPMLLLAATCLPALIIVVATALTASNELVAGYTSYLVNVQIVIAVYVAGQAPVTVSRDLRFAVTTLYFSRPLDRVDYVAAKFAAMAAAIAVLVGAPLTILFVGALVLKLPLADQLPDYLRALAGAGLLALVLAGIGLVIAALTPRRGLGIAAVITVLTVLMGIQAVAQEIALERGAPTVAAYTGLLSPFTMVDGVQSSLLGAESVVAASPPGVVGGLVYLVVAVTIVVGALAALMLRYRKVSVS